MPSSVRLLALLQRRCYTRVPTGDPRTRCSFCLRSNRPASPYPQVLTLALNRGCGVLRLPRGGCRTRAADHQTRRYTHAHTPRQGGRVPNTLPPSPFLPTQIPLTSPNSGAQDDDSDDDEGAPHPSGAGDARYGGGGGGRGGGGGGGAVGDEERVAAEQRERLRAERKKDRERDLRMDVRSRVELSFFSSCVVFGVFFCVVFLGSPGVGSRCCKGCGRDTG